MRLLPLVLLAFCLNACGGGEESGSSAGSNAKSRPGTEAAPLKVSGGGSAQFRVKEGDNSIAEYGTEAATSQLTEAARVLHLYLTARAARDWGLACDHLSPRERHQLAQLVSSSSQLAAGGCAAALGALLAAVTAGTAREMTVVDAASLRRDGDGAFLLYHGADHADYFIAMAEQDGAWKVAALDPSILP